MIRISSKPMNFLNHLDYLIYSSHKTCTQTLRATLSSVGKANAHIHHLEGLSDTLPFHSLTTEFSTLKRSFLEALAQYKLTKGVKLNVLTVVRNPFDRFLSSFFHSKHSYEVRVANRQHSATTIMKTPLGKLPQLYKNFIQDKENIHLVESILEMCAIFETDVFSLLQKQKGGYYTYENDLISLTVLRFDSVPDASYLSNALTLPIEVVVSENKSIDKVYYGKYKSMKVMMKEELDVLPHIQTHYTEAQWHFFKTFELV